MGALQYVTEPNYSALILRRTYADLALPGAIMARAREWLYGSDARWSDKDKRFTFPSGATLTFGYLESEKDKFRYQGAEFNYIAFDELTQFPDTQYRYLMSRLRRTTESVVPVRMRSAGNPGGVGHEWVKQRFIAEGEKYSRPFISAKLEDNPHLNQEEYDFSLSQLDHITRQQLRFGDWDVVVNAGNFEREWFEEVEVDLAGAQMVRFWDMAASKPEPGVDPDYTVGIKLAKKRGVYYIADVRRDRTTSAAVEELIYNTALNDGYEVPIYIEQEPGSSGKAWVENYIRNVLAGWQVKADRPTGKKVSRAQPVVSQAAIRNIKLCPGDWHTALLDELQAYPEGQHDDQVDALSGAFGALVQRQALQGDIPAIYHMRRCPTTRPQTCGEPLLAPPWMEVVQCWRCGWSGPPDATEPYHAEQDELQVVA